MDSSVTRFEGAVHAVHGSSTEPPVKTEGLKTATHRFTKDLPYPMVIEHAASSFRGVEVQRNGETIDVDVLETVPRIRSRSDGDVCTVDVMVSYRVNETTLTTGGRRGRATLQFDHQLIYREADDVLITVTD